MYDTYSLALSGLIWSVLVVERTRIIVCQCSSSSVGGDSSLVASVDAAAAAASEHNYISVLLL